MEIDPLGVRLRRLGWALGWDVRYLDESLGIVLCANDPQVGPHYLVYENASGRLPDAYAMETRDEAIYCLVLARENRDARAA